MKWMMFICIDHNENYDSFIDNTSDQKHEL